MAATTQSSRIVVGAAYERAMSAAASDRRARLAFQDLALSIASPGATLFDFGAGTGIDACVYAERGLTVGAYDVDPEMRRYFALRCRRHIKAGRITLDAGNYPQFLARDAVNGGRRVELVTSNFAPLNLIADLAALFEKLHALTLPGGKVLVSVLSPYFIGDLKYGWWWRNGVRLWRVGHFSVSGAQASIFRRRLGDFARHSAPYFQLMRAFPGLPRHRAQPVDGIDMTRASHHAWLRLATCRFMFLLFERRDMDSPGGSGH
jgi:SAM-dependent methyltransferase